MLGIQFAYGGWRPTVRLQSLTEVNKWLSQCWFYGPLYVISLKQWHCRWYKWKPSKRWLILSGFSRGTTIRIIDNKGCNLNCLCPEMEIFYGCLFCVFFSWKVTDYRRNVKDNVCVDVLSVSWNFNHEGKLLGNRPSGLREHHHYDVITPSCLSAGLRPCTLKHPHFLKLSLLVLFCSVIISDQWDIRKWDTRKGIYIERLKAGDLRDPKMWVFQISGFASASTWHKVCFSSIYLLLGVCSVLEDTGHGISELVSRHRRVLRF
jgi:hypothetical protein